MSISGQSKDSHRNVPYGGATGLPGGADVEPMYEALRGPRRPTSSRGLRVLIVDAPADGQRVADLLHLRFTNVQIDVAVSARQAIAAARRRTPDVIVLNNDLPDGEAIDVLARLSVARGTTLCPIVVVTNEADIDLAVRLLRMGAADYIWKQQFEGDPESAASVLERSINHSREQHRLARRAALYRANTLVKRRRERVALEEVERQRQEAEFARERLRLAIDGAGLGTWDWNTQTGRIGHNDLLLTMLGYGPEELDFSYTVWRSMMHPEDRAATLKALGDHLEGRTPEYRVECRLRMKNERWKWVLTSGRVVRRDEQGRALRVAGVNLDIDQRKRADLAIIEAKNYAERSEQQLVEMLTSISDAFLTLDRQWQFTYVNPQAERLLSTQSQHVIGKEIFDAYPALKQTALEPAMRKAMSERISTTVVAHLGTINRWVDARCYPSAEGISLFLLDVSELQEQQERLQESERLANRRLAEIESIYQAAAVGLAFIDRDLKYVSANDTLAAIHGVTASALIGRSVESMLSPELFARLLPRYRNVLNEGEREELELELESAGAGSSRVYLVRYSPVVGPGGRVDGISVAANDITDRKRHEKRLQAAMRHADAARVSAERAKEIAEQASRAKSEFLAVLSHELRTPLTPVLAGTQLLRDELAAANQGLTQEARDMLAMIHRNVELEVRLIDDLLDLTRIARGKLQLDRKVVDLNEAVQNVCSISTPQPDARRPELRCDLKAEQAHVLADPARLQQVLWNLVSNANKFTRADGSIDLRTYNQSTPEGTLVVCEVQDTGVGIDPEVLPTIFNAFEQGGQRVTRTFGGLGLGLAISHALVQAHGGTIEAFSEGRDRGAMFRITLPLSTRTPATDRAAPAPPADPPGRRRVLLIEDHGDTSKLMSRFLQRRLGLQVSTADNLASARKTATEMVAGERFDLIISDIGLPDGTGMQLIGDLRHLLDPLPPAVALSGYGTEQDVQNSLRAGFCAHLTKPVDLDLLERTVRQLLADGAANGD